MLAKAVEDLPTGPVAYEAKWDGSPDTWRCLIGWASGGPASERQAYQWKNAEAVSPSTNEQKSAASCNSMPLSASSQATAGEPCRPHSR